MNHIFPRPIWIPLVISILLLNWYAYAIKSYYLALYYIWIVIFGILFLKYRERIVTTLRHWDVRPSVKFISVGYAMVLIEEIMVALLHSLTEGFSLQGFGLLIFQFWAFNIFAFTGFIVGWYFLVRRFHYSTIDLFILIGIWGLISERTLTFLGTDTIASLLLILPTMTTYNFIIAPSIASMSQMGERIISPWKKYPFTILLLFIFSILPVLLLTPLHTKFPGAFPPCEYIPCP